MVLQSRIQEQLRNPMKIGGAHHDIWILELLLLQLLLPELRC
jgi:hypothetical protein